MNYTEFVIVGFAAPIILGFIYVGLVALFAIFFYKDSDTDKAQLKALKEILSEEKINAKNKRKYWFKNIKKIWVSS